MPSKRVTRLQKKTQEFTRVQEAMLPRLWAMFVFLLKSKQPTDMAWRLRNVP